MRNTCPTAWVSLIALTVHQATVLGVAAQDCPQWRGPHRDGAIHGVTVPKQWPKALKAEWKTPVGEGVSSPVVVGQRIYVFTPRRGLAPALVHAHREHPGQTQRTAVQAQRSLGCLLSHDFSISADSAPAINVGRWPNEKM